MVEVVSNTSQRPSRTSKTAANGTGESVEQPAQARDDPCGNHVVVLGLFDLLCFDNPEKKHDAEVEEQKDRERQDGKEANGKQDEVQNDESSQLCVTCVHECAVTLAEWMEDEGNKVFEFALGEVNNTTCWDNLVVPIDAVISTHFVGHSCSSSHIHVYRFLHAQWLAPPEGKCYRVQARHRKRNQLEFRECQPLQSTRNALKYEPGRLQDRKQFRQPISFRPIFDLCRCYSREYDRRVTNQFLESIHG